MCRFQDLFNVAEQPLKVNYLNKRVLQQWNPIVSSKRFLLLSRHQDQGSGSLEHNMVMSRQVASNWGFNSNQRSEGQYQRELYMSNINHGSFIALLNDESKNPGAMYNTAMSDLQMKLS